MGVFLVHWTKMRDHHPLPRSKVQVDRVQPVPLAALFGNVRFSREKPPKLYRVPYRQRIQHSLPLHCEICHVDHEGDTRVRNHKGDTRVRNHEGDGQVRYHVGDAWVSCYSWVVSVACQQAENQKSGKLEFESD